MLLLSFLLLLLLLLLFWLLLLNVISIMFTITAIFIVIIVISIVILNHNAKTAGFQRVAHRAPRRAPRAQGSVLLLHGRRSRPRGFRQGIKT